MFVLMTTNYTLNPTNYYISDDHEYSRWKSIMIYFPIFQIVIGVIYFVYKIIRSGS